MVHMSTKKQSKNKPTNARLRQLIKEAGLTQAAALKEFNRGQAKAISISGFKAWLADPGAERWRELSEAYLAHAEKVLGRVAPK